MAGVKDVGARAGCACALGRDEACNRNRRGKNVLDDRAHRSIKTARRIHLQHDQPRLARHGTGKSGLNVVGRRRPDHAVDPEHQHLTAGCSALCCAADRKNECCQQQQPRLEKPRKPPTHHSATSRSCAYRKRKTLMCFCIRSVSLPRKFSAALLIDIRFSCFVIPFGLATLCAIARNGAPSASVMRPGRRLSARACTTIESETE